MKLGPNYECLGCGIPLESSRSVTGTDEDVPTPGAISVCLHCTNVAVFTENGLRPPTPEERKQFASAPEIQATKTILRYFATDPKAN